MPLDNTFQKSVLASLPHPEITLESSTKFQYPDSQHIQTQPYLALGFPKQQTKMGNWTPGIFLFLFFIMENSKGKENTIMNCYTHPPSFDYYDQSSHPQPHPLSSLLDGFQCLSLKDKCFKKRKNKTKTTKLNTQLKHIITPENTLGTLNCL